MYPRRGSTGSDQVFTLPRTHWVALAWLLGAACGEGEATNAVEHGELTIVLSRGGPGPYDPDRDAIAPEAGVDPVDSRSTYGPTVGPLPLHTDGQPGGPLCTAGVVCEFKVFLPARVWVQPTPGYPVVILKDGNETGVGHGGFAYSAHASLARWRNYLTGRGYAVITVARVRTSAIHGTDFPIAVAEVIDWVTTSGAKVGLDPTLIALMGHSGGSNGVLIPAGMQRLCTDDMVTHGYCVGDLDLDNQAFRRGRIKAVVGLSPKGDRSGGIIGDLRHEVVKVPTMLITSTTDLASSNGTAMDLYLNTPEPQAHRKQELVLDVQHTAGVDANHSFMGEGPEAGAAAVAVEVWERMASGALAFLDSTLLGVKLSSAETYLDVDLPGLSGNPPLAAADGYTVGFVAGNPAVAGACGNGITDGAEECDVLDDDGLNFVTGAEANGDGCDVNCTRSACGNGIAAGGEECDDGSADTHDGCDACRITAFVNPLVGGRMVDATAPTAHRLCVERGFTNAHHWTSTDAAGNCLGNGSQYMRWNGAAWTPAVAGPLPCPLFSPDRLAEVVCQ